MLKKSSVISFIFIVSTCIQLVSQIIVTRLFGANQDLDVFLAAVTIPTIIITIIYGSLNNILIPILGDKKNTKSSEEIAASMIFTLGAISIGIAIICSFLAIPLGQWLYPGRDTSFTVSVSQQMSFLFIAIPFAVIASILGAYFYSQKKFARFPIAQLMGSLINLGIILVLFNRLGIWALVIGFIVNIIGQILFIFPVHFKPIHFKFVNVRIILLALIPLLVGEFMRRTDTLFIRSYASYLPTGYFVYLNLVSKIFSLATSVTTIGIQVLLLPHLVEYFTGKQYNKAFATVNKSKIFAIIISIVVTIAIIIAGPFAINLLFLGGKFTANDVKVTNELLTLFIIPAIGWGISGVFFQPLFALKKYTAVGVINTVAVLLAWLTANYVHSVSEPLYAIISGLIVLLFVGIIGSEFVWQQEKQLLLKQK